jgi:hypothetical protein
MARRVSMLDAWYGPARAAQMRRARALGEFRPAVAQPYTGAQRTFLAGRMNIIMTALRSAHGIALTTAQNWPTASTLDWKRFVPVLNIISTVTATQDEAKRQVISTLRSTMANLVNQREAAMQDVLDGSLSFANWLKGVEATSKGLVSVLSTLGEFSIANGLKDTVQNVVSDISRATIWVGVTAREQLEKLPERAERYGPFLIGGAVLLGAFIVYQYATAPLKLLPRGDQ